MIRQIEENDIENYNNNIIEYNYIIKDDRNYKQYICIYIDYLYMEEVISIL